MGDNVGELQMVLKVLTKILNGDEVPSFELRTALEILNKIGYE